MNNFERWQSYMDGCISPQNYVDWGFYYLISAALQRRVWIGPDHARLYPNIYVVLVGEPGVGKGLVIKQVAEIIKYHKLEDPNVSSKVLGLNETDKQVAEEVAKADYKLAQEQEGNLEGKDKSFRSFEKPLRIPLAADATTYEALVRSMSKAVRRINYEHVNGEGQKTLGIYVHSSLCFCLEEISSLFRKRTEDLVHFLIQTYDCGDYTYDTKTQGKDRVRKCCLNFFGGTTPGFMQTTFDDQLLTEGFASRTFFIFNTQNRKIALFIPDLSKEQREHYRAILDHVDKLTRLYGRVSIDKDTEKFLEEWWQSSQKSRPNTNLKLNPYYARKNIHVLKLAMSIHFAESTEMHIDKVDFEKAINVLAADERRMHFALGLENNNPLSGPAKKILGYIGVFGKQTRRELLTEFWDALPGGADDLDTILEFYKAQGKIISVNGDVNAAGESPICYDIVRKDI